MKEQFTLAVRIVGLLLFCYSLIGILQTIPVVFTFSEALNNNMLGMKVNGEDLLALGQKAKYSMSMEPNWLKVFVYFAVVHLSPLIFGLYLMRSGKLFINICYPEIIYVNPSAKEANDDWKKGPIKY